MKRLLAIAFSSMALAGFADAFTVTDVSARQRWPWNGLVDVDFTIAGASVADLFKVEVEAAYDGGTKKLYARTYLEEPLRGPGFNRITWDLAADYPELKVDDLQVAVTVTPLSRASLDAQNVYMVIDLSSGPNSTRYPVRYTTTAPTLVPTNDLVACAADPNRTTKLWLKRVKANTFPFGGTNSNSGEGDFKVSLSPYYIGVFELTQKQWALVMDTWPSVFSNDIYRAARPVSNINNDEIIGHNNWPENRVMADGSYVAKMRARTGLATFSLPTEAQWECASRAGSAVTTQISKSTGRCADYVSTSGVNTYNEGPEVGTALVGSYNANAWGLYDMFGNVMEMCLDAHDTVDNLKTLYGWNAETREPIQDPIGPGVNATARYHATRGGSYGNSAGFCASHRRDYNSRSETGTKRASIGFRVAVSPEWN